ncbi:MULTISPECIES: HNH endonuclease [Pseudomonas]|uniref:HNH endonuclease n=1 Tax=Pseudomonas TaxID=286 RepID=UPI003AF08858
MTIFYLILFFNNAFGCRKYLRPKIGGSHFGTSPPKLTWHHGDRSGSLQLVDKNDRKIYHPGGTGGRNEWGGGAACR